MARNRQMRLNRLTEAGAILLIEIAISPVNRCNHHIDLPSGKDFFCSVKSKAGVSSEENPFPIYCNNSPYGERSQSPMITVNITYNKISCPDFISRSDIGDIIIVQPQLSHEISTIRRCKQFCPSACQKCRHGIPIKMVKMEMGCQNQIKTDFLREKQLGKQPLKPDIPFKAFPALGEIQIPCKSLPRRAF